jgi:hypothetical protein
MEMDFCVVFCDMAELKPICLYPLGPYPEIHLIQYEICQILAFMHKFHDFQQTIF